MNFGEQRGLQRIVCVNKQLIGRQFGFLDGEVKFEPRFVIVDLMNRKIEHFLDLGAEAESEMETEAVVVAEEDGGRGVWRIHPVIFCCGSGGGRGRGRKERVVEYGVGLVVLKSGGRPSFSFSILLASRVLMQNSIFLIHFFNVSSLLDHAFGSQSLDLLEGQRILLCCFQCCIVVIERFSMTMALLKLSLSTEEVVSFVWLTIAGFAP